MSSFSLTPRQYEPSGSCSDSGLRLKLLRSQNDLDMMGRGGDLWNNNGRTGINSLSIDKELIDNEKNISSLIIKAIDCAEKGQKINATYLACAIKKLHVK